MVELGLEGAKKQKSAERQPAFDKDLNRNYSTSNVIDNHGLAH